MPANKASHFYAATSLQQRRRAWEHGQVRPAEVHVFDRVTPEPLVVHNLAAAGAEAANARKGVACIGSRPPSSSGNIAILMSGSQAYVELVRMPWIVCQGLHARHLRY